MSTPDTTGSLRCVAAAQLAAADMGVTIADGQARFRPAKHAARNRSVCDLKGVHPRTMNKGTVTPYVAAKGADRFLDFVEAVFATEKAVRVRNPDGTVGHAEVRVGDSVVMAFDSRPEWPFTPAFLSVYVPDSDAVVAKALAADATLVTEVTTSGIVGERGGRIKDPVGNIWWVQTKVEDVDEATMLARFADPAELAIMRRVQESFDREMRSTAG
jgi:uncharacterized glyoxalase superfamily protein PhnB